MDRPDNGSYKPDGNWIDFASDEEEDEYWDIMEQDSLNIQDMMDRVMP